MKNSFKEGDWAAYNWLDDDDKCNWKVGRIVNTEMYGLMYFNDDGTKRSGYIPITEGVKLLKND